MSSSLYLESRGIYHKHWVLKNLSRFMQIYPMYLHEYLKHESRWNSSWKMKLLSSSETKYHYPKMSRPIQSPETRLVVFYVNVKAPTLKNTFSLTSRKLESSTVTFSGLLKPNVALIKVRYLCIFWEEVSNKFPFTFLELGYI